MYRSPSNASGAVIASGAAIVLGTLGMLGACAGTAKPARRPCPTAAIVIAGQDDVDALAGCTTAHAITIRTGVALDLVPLASLATIIGDLRVGPSVALDELRLPGLRSVGGAIDIASNGDLHGVFLASLERAGQLAIEGNVALTTISLPRLQAVSGSLAVSRSGDLELLELSALVSVDGELAITDNARLTLLELAGLQRAGSMRIANNPALPPDLVDGLVDRVGAKATSPVVDPAPGSVPPPAAMPAP